MKLLLKALVVSLASMFAAEATNAQMPPPPGNPPPDPGGMIPPMVIPPQCEPIKPFKTGENKIRGLERMEKAVSAAKWISEQMSNVVSSVAGAAAGAKCKPYTMLTFNGKQEYWTQGCCIAPKPDPVMEDYSTKSLTVNYQLGANCEYIIGTKSLGVPAAFASSVDAQLAALGIVPLLRFQMDGSVGGGGLWVVEDKLQCPTTAGIGGVGSGMVQGAAGLQIGWDKSTPSTNWGGWRWPPWNRKYFIRVTMQGRGNVGVLWGSGNTWAWQPRPSVSACLQERVRLWDFIDIDQSQCYNIVSFF